LPVLLFISLCIYITSANEISRSVFIFTSSSQGYKSDRESAVQQKSKVLSNNALWTKYIVPKVSFFWDVASPRLAYKFLFG